MRTLNWRWKCGLCTTKSWDSWSPKPRRLCKWEKIPHWHELPWRLPRFPSIEKKSLLLTPFSILAPRADYWKSLLTRTWWTAWVQKGAIVKFRSPISASSWRLLELLRADDNAAFNFGICSSWTSGSYWMEIRPRVVSLGSPNVLLWIWKIWEIWGFTFFSTTR